jgi:cytochrome b
MTMSAWQPEAGTTSGQDIRVWDPVVRLFHWTVVIGCGLNLFVFDDGKAIHRYIGYAVAGVLVMRVVWGFIGTRHARFADFVPRPAAFLRYVKELLRGEEPRFIGHNPAGALVMLLLMLLLAAVSVTGWMLTLDAYFGNEELEEMHDILANGILVVAAFHAAAALFESWRHRENLIWSMITGRKRP